MKKTNAMNHTYEELEQKVRELGESSQKLQVLEKELRESRNRYQRMIEAVTSYIFSVRIENSRAVETVHRSPCEAITGYTTEDFYADPYLWIKMVPVEDHHIVNEQVACLLSGGRAITIEHRIIRKDGLLRWVSNTPVPHYDLHANLVAYDGLITDITERKIIEEEKESLIAELKRALDEIRTLKGIIPICSFCKGMRDDQGYWKQLEEYISSHSEAKLSHGICPACAKKHYPDIFGDDAEK